MGGSVALRKGRASPDSARPLLRRTAPDPLLRPRSYRPASAHLRSHRLSALSVLSVHSAHSAHSALSALSKGNRVSSVGDVRTLWLGGGGDTRTNAGFPDNRVITSKYTLWNFLPKNLFEQFRRIANFYFLCMTILALSIESPVSPATSFVPLVFVIFVTTVKQGYEDWLRHRSDNEVNNALVTVVRSGCRQRIQSKEVQVGDLVMVRRDEDVPCDLVLLASSDVEGRAHVTTANLDGETNLKEVRLPSTAPLPRLLKGSVTKLPQTLYCPRMLRLFSRPEQLAKLRARIECEHPNADLYHFYGKIEVIPGDDSVYASLLETDPSELDAASGELETAVTGPLEELRAPASATSSSNASASVSALDNTLKEAASESTSAVPSGYMLPASSPLLLRAAPPAPTPAPTQQAPPLDGTSDLRRRSGEAPSPRHSQLRYPAPAPAGPHTHANARGEGTAANGTAAHDHANANANAYASKQRSGAGLSSSPSPSPPPTRQAHESQSAPVECEGGGAEGGAAGGGAPAAPAAPAAAAASAAVTPRARTLPAQLRPASIAVPSHSHSLSRDAARESPCAMWALPTPPTTAAAVLAARSAAAVAGPAPMRHSLAFGETITNGRRSLKRIGLVLGVRGSGVADAMATEVVAAAAATTAPSAQSLRARKLEENGATPAAAAVPVRRFSVGLSAPLGSENLLLRGTRLRNTDYVYGCAVYTGQQTKLALNWRLTSNKFSTIEKTVNKFLLFFLLLLMTETGASLGLKYAIELSFASQMKWYLGDVFTVSSLTVINDLFSFVILYNYIIPISLYVTIEMQKFLGTLFFEWDALLYDPNTELSAVCNSSDLNEELGQVEVLFTDKTGTLTENDMQFRRCSVGGVVYAEQDGVLTRLGADMDVTRGQPVAALSGELEEFFVALALCHTVQMDAAPPNNNAPAADCLTYQASSPDEKALTEAAARVGVVFLGEEGDFASVQVKGEVRRYRKLDVLEFSSDRKRMSVVVEDEAGNVVLLCKGAETAVLPLADAGPTHETQAHVNDFAMRGLRVMMVGSRLLERAELHALEQQVEVARQTVSQQRAQLVAAAYARMEAGLRLLGATAVEDRLQDGVQETLESLRAAGVAVWILTGDKEETAVNISYSCGHFKNGTEQLYLTKHKNFDNCVASLERYRERVLGDRHRQYGMVVDGESLALALRSPDLLREVALCCYAVVCCRMSPLQKSEVVQMVKTSPHAPVTAAIGDGANDVSMIQEAHVGLGVMGREGRQAARCADFAFARFRFLRRVLLVHGHWYYERLATLVQYFFYKNVVFITPQLYFAIFSAFSMQALYDSLFLTLFNVFFTSLPVLLYGLLEQRVPARELFALPERYKEVSCNALLRWTSFGRWLLFGFWHSLVVFFVPYVMLYINPVVHQNSQPLELLAFSCVVFHNVVVVVNLKLLMQSRHWTFPFVFSIIISVLGFIVIALAYSSIRLEPILDSTMYKIYNQLLATPSFWMVSILTIVVCLVPDLTYSVLHKHIRLKKMRKLFGKFSCRNRGHLSISSAASTVN